MTYTDLNFAIIVKRGTWIHLFPRRIFNKSVTQPQHCFYREYNKLVMQSTKAWDQQRNIIQLFKNRPYLSDFCLTSKMHWLQLLRLSTYRKHKNLLQKILNYLIQSVHNHKSITTIPRWILIFCLKYEWYRSCMLHICSYPIAKNLKKRHTVLHITRQAFSYKTGWKCRECNF